MQTRKSTGNKPNGFSLIELMIVVSIIGVLSWFSLPKYQNYLLKSTVSSQMLMAVKPIQMAIQEYVALNGQMPTSFTDFVEVGFVDNNGDEYDSETDFSISAVSAVNISFPTDSSSELIMAIKFACDSLDKANCTKLSPQPLRTLVLELSAKINSNNGALYFLIDPTRENNKAFKAFLPVI